MIDTLFLHNVKPGMVLTNRIDGVDLRVIVVGIEGDPSAALVRPVGSGNRMPRVVQMDEGHGCVHVLTDDEPVDEAPITRWIGVTAVREGDTVVLHDDEGMTVGTVTVTASRIVGDHGEDQVITGTDVDSGHLIEVTYAPDDTIGLVTRAGQGCQHILSDADREDWPIIAVCALPAGHGPNHRGNGRAWHNPED